MRIDIEKIPLVAVEFMNKLHLEDASIINRLYDRVSDSPEDVATDENKNLIIAVFEEWLNHTRKHFAAEEEEMILKNFPPYPIHKSEHESCLLDMQSTLEEWRVQPNISFMKSYIESYMQWLEEHIQTLDTMTALFIKQSSISF